MYIHVILFIFLIFLFVLSLEQALTDVQHNSTNTNHEEHPGDLSICTSGVSKEIEKRQQKYDTNLQNLTVLNSTNDQQKFVENDSEPSCSFTNNFNSKQLFNCANNSMNLCNEQIKTRGEPDETELVKWDPSRLQLVPVQNRFPEFKKHNASYTLGVYSHNNDRNQFLNDYENTPVPIDTPSTHLQLTKYVNNYIRDSHRYKENCEQFGFKSFETTFQNDIDSKNREKGSINNNHDEIEINKRVENNPPISKEVNQNDSPIILNQSLSLLDAFKNQNILPYYVSENEFNKIKCYQEHSCNDNNKSKYKKINCDKLHLYPVLVSDNLLKNLLLLKGSNKAFDSLGFHKPKSKCFMNTDQTLQSQTGAINLLNKRIMNNIMNRNSKIGSSTTEPDTSRLMQLLSRNQSQYGNVSTLNSNITPTNKRYVTVKYSTAPSVQNPYQDGNNNENINDQLSKLLQNFFNVLADSVSSSKNETNVYNTSTDMSTTNNIQELKTDSFVSNINNIDEDGKKYQPDNEIDNYVIKITKELNKTNLDSNQECNKKSYTVLDKVENNLFKNEINNQPLLLLNNDNDESTVEQNANIFVNSKYPDDQSTSNLNRITSQINIVSADNFENTTSNNKGCDNAKPTNSGSIKKIIQHFNGKQLNNFCNSILNHKEVKKNNRVELRDIALPVFLVAQPDFQPEEITKSYETSNDYVNPLIYWQKKMLPEFPLNLPNLNYKNRSQGMCDTNRGVISGKIYVTGPNNTIPDMIHIINPDLIRTIHERAGPRNVHFCLDNSNEKLPSCPIDSRLRICIAFHTEIPKFNENERNNVTSTTKENNRNSITLPNTNLCTGTIVDSSKEALLQQLKRINETLKLIREEIHTQFNISTDNVKN